MADHTPPIDASEDCAVNPRLGAGAPTIGELATERLSRRGVLKASAGLGSLLAASACASTQGGTPARDEVQFQEIARGIDETHHAPKGYETQILIGWGDAVFADAPAFDPASQSAAGQERQFGYNNDFIGYVPLPAEGAFEERALLCVNHEYTSTNLMFPGVTSHADMTAAMCLTEIAAHGGTIVEVVRLGGVWSVRTDSPLNRRITGSTPMRLSGPAAGHARLRTAADPTGLNVLGTLNNCAGGVTPWGAYLMAEENFNGYFGGALPEGHRETENHKRYGVPGGWYAWSRHFKRFDVGAEPNEPNRFGWVVEVDPLNPSATPIKRTALGRFKHEGAETVIAPDGRVVLYMGDDQRFDYAYKFVTSRPYRAGDADWNRDLLDDGVLYVARFDADGTVAWLPLVFGEGPLTPANGFQSQADVLIETRRAADLLEATPMDRPEDFEANPATGRAYLMLTNNTARTAEQVDAANPRANNAAGHIIEIIEPGGDFAATSSRWEILVRCGDPADPEAGAVWNPATSADGWFGSPDNCAIDPSGRLWVSTDGNEKTGAADGLWHVGVAGETRGRGKAFYRTPVGAELCGPRFSPDGRTLFVAVQHPGDGDGASYENPTTRWPDFKPGTPPRPAVVAIRRKDGGPIGS